MTPRSAQVKDEVATLQAGVSSMQDTESLAEVDAARPKLPGCSKGE